MVPGRVARATVKLCLKKAKQKGIDSWATLVGINFLNTYTHWGNAARLSASRP